jgi:hypothetical protein
MRSSVGKRAFTRLDEPGHVDAHPGERVRIRSWILGGAADD